MSVDRRFALLRHDHGTGSPDAFDLSGAANGDFIVYNSTTGKWEAVDDRFDMTGASNGDRLEYNSSSGLWEPYTPAEYPRPNLLVNGMMAIWQDVAARWKTAAATGQTIADNFKVMKFITSAVVTSGRVQMSSTLSPGKYYCQLKVTTADASVGATDIMGIQTYVEGRDWAQLRWGHSTAKDVTITFLHAHTKTGTHSITVKNSAANRAYTAEYTQTNANSWEVATVTIPGDTSGTWLDDERTGMRLIFCAMVGTTYDQTAGSWGAVNAYGSDNQVNNMDSTANYFRIGSVKIEVGAEFSGFYPVTFGDELLKCQRYWYKTYEYDTQIGTASTIEGSGRHYQVDGTSYQRNATVNIPFPVPMRVSPTLTGYSSATGTSGKIRDTVAAADVTCNFPGTGNPWSADPWGTQNAANTTLNFQVHIRADARMS